VRLGRFAPLFSELWPGQALLRLTQLSATIAIMLLRSVRVFVYYQSDLIVA